VRQYSPLHRATPMSGDPESGIAPRRFKYPQALFVSSSNDDRTHPAHGRKLVAKMNDVSGGDALSETFLYEEAEGGHGGNADLKQTARQKALMWLFFWRALAPEVDIEEGLGK